MREVVGLEIDWRRPAVTRREVFQQFDSRTCRRTERRDLEPRTEHVVQVLLLDAIVLRAASDAEAKPITIVTKRSIGVARHDRRVIDTEKESILALPPLVALTVRKRQDFEEVAIWIAKIKRLDSSRILDPLWQALRTRRRMRDALGTQSW